MNFQFGISANQALDLYQVISENAPDAVKTGEIKNHFGRKVAIVSRKLQNTKYPTLIND